MKTLEVVHRSSRPGERGLQTPAWQGSKRGGFTLVELLVVIAIIGVLVAMAIPAVQASRELGRRAICQSNLSQVMLALQNYENAFEALPSGVVNPDGPIRNEPVGLHQGWLMQMLPYLDQRNAYDRIDWSKSVYDPANAPVRKLSLAVLVCPSEPRHEPACSNYAGCHHDVEAPIAADNHGVLYLNSRIRRHEISDGAAYTIFVAEKRLDIADLGWMSGTRATLRNTGTRLNATPTDAAPGGSEAADNEQTGTPGSLLYVGGFGSGHVSGAFVGFGDSSVRFVNDEIDQPLWQRLGNRADGGLVDGSFDVD
jgi:prepilin-type N-terminal cleavage/methylation domain-containing protein